MSEKPTGRRRRAHPNGVAADLDINPPAHLDTSYPLPAEWPSMSEDSHMSVHYSRKTRNDSDSNSPLLPPLTPAERRRDYQSIALLLLLYLLQGIPLGLTASIPMVLQSRKISYHDQAIFSFAYWPFSLKLLWAPIVDSVYWSVIGRRKSWLVPTQYLIGGFMFVLSHFVNDILGDGSPNAHPNVYFLTAVFFALNFLAATQDIAVDGWALTMLSKQSVGYASTCNAVGQTAGWFIGNVVFLSLESKEFCNSYLRSIPQETGIVTLAGFVYFWAIVYVVSTSLVLLLKREVNNHLAEDEAEHDIGVVATYKLVWKLVRLKPVLFLVFVLLTAKIGFAAPDGITGLKLLEKGVPKDKLAVLAIPLIPLQIILPWIIGRYTSGPYPMRVYLKSYIFRLLFGLMMPLVVYITPSFQLPDGHFPFTYYLMIVMLYCVHQMPVYAFFVSQMAFGAQISDPLIGGSYMTLLNTVSNLGGNWPVTLSLSVVDDVTWADCYAGNVTRDDGSGGPNGVILPGMDCHADEKACKDAGGHCVTEFDGYYLLCATCTCLGLFWWLLLRRRIDALHSVKKDAWTVKSTASSRIQ